MKSPHQIDRIAQLIFNTPWAITPDYLGVVVDVVTRRLEGRALSESEIAAVTAARPSMQTQGAIAVVPVFGLIANRMNLMSDISGGTSVDQLRSQIRAQDHDPDVSAIVLDVNSPGGTVHGVFELAEEIRGLSTRTAAVINDTGGSAAYALASATDEIVATPSALVGSVGIVFKHRDESEAEAKLGVKTTIITSDESKAAANTHEPLSDPARARLEALVEHFRAMFVDAVVKGRNAAGQHLQAATVQTKWKAEVYTATEALGIGMIDRIGSMDDTLVRLGAPGRRAAASRRSRRAARALVGA